MEENEDFKSKRKLILFPFSRNSEMKRKAPSNGEIDENFVRRCEQEFSAKPENILIRNAVMNVGSFHTAINADESRKITHIFTNTLKRPNVKATNQGASGRCWLFAALNVFRHSVMNGLEMKNFQFSQTFLYFWDKFERSNTFLQYFVTHDASPEDRMTDFVLEHCVDDGGYWHFFVNLVDKYGLVPVEVMPETFTSDDSQSINDALKERLLACACMMQKTRTDTEPARLETRLLQMKAATLEQVYAILVKFLGDPPKKFSWRFEVETENGPRACLIKSSPEKFREMCMSGLNLRDFVVISDVPCVPYNETYQVPDCTNVYGSETFRMLNLPIDEIKAVAKKSILHGLPVWFGADMKGFNPCRATFDNHLQADDLLLGKYKEPSKGDKIRFQSLKSEHAMTLMGLNLDRAGRPTEWQIENSWGYADYEEAGMDGFNSAKDEWFDTNVIMVAVHKRFLTRRIEPMLWKEPVLLNPWSVLAPALVVGGKGMTEAQKRQLEQWKN